VGCTNTEPMSLGSSREAMEGRQRTFKRGKGTEPHRKGTYKVLQKLQKCHKSVPSVLRECYEGVTSVSQVCCRVFFGNVGVL
jgi:hypothetical protein